MHITVAVVGAGRMGTVIARQLPKGTKKLIMDTDPVKAGRLAAEVGGIPACSCEALNEADLIAVVIPAPAVHDTIEALLSSAKAGALVLNMSTLALIDPAVKSRNPSVLVIDAKIIGHAAAMSQGNPGIVVAKTDDQAAFHLIKSQLPGFQEVVPGDADLVAEINERGTVEALRIAVNLRKQLRAMAVPETWIPVVLKTVCAGVIRAFADDDLGDFGREMVRRLEPDKA